MHGDSRRWAARFLPVVLTAAAALLGCGCESKRQIDAAVDALVDALRRNDVEAMKRISTPSFLEDMTPERMEHLSKALKALGDFRERTMRSLNIQAGVSKSATYELSFDGGSINLDITLSGGKIGSVTFSGDAFDWALKQAAAQPADFAVKRFEFLSPDGKPNPQGNAFTGAQPITFRIDLQGLTPGQGEMHARVHLKVLDHAGKLLVEQRDFIDSTSKAETGGSAAVSLKGTFSGLAAGTYNLRFTIEDVGGNRSIEYSQSVVVM